ncbi:tetratricopeptide repeat protein [Streptomyces sp. NPDC006314]|uniref:tetratricopeptide repeat protein n=1 Tax=Streptomyces sp. NPDC006314 TaxID=3154475 RepID=UPI0033AFD11C
MGLGRTYARLGRWEEAVDHLRTSIDLCHIRGNTALESRYLVVLGETLLAAGRPVEARETFTRGVALSPGADPECGPHPGGGHGRASCRTAATPPSTRKTLVVHGVAPPYIVKFPEPCANRVVHLRRAHAGLPDEHLRGLTATPIAATEELGAILTPFFATLVGWHSHPPAVSGPLAVSVVDLLGTLVAERSGTGIAGSAREHIGAAYP